MRVIEPPVAVPAPAESYDLVPTGGVEVEGTGRKHVLVPHERTGGVFLYVRDDDETVLFTVSGDAEVVGGAAVCRRLASEPRAQPVTRRALSQIDPQWLAYRYLGAAGRGDDYTPDAEAAWDALGTAPRRRRVTPQRL